MINPPALALRRRSEELCASAEREIGRDIDTAALLLFYSAECGLKSAYMMQNNLKYTDDSRGAAASARSFSHNIGSLIQALNIARASINPMPQIMIIRSGLKGAPSVLHEAWRYGEKVQNTDVICEWLTSLIKWCRNNR